MTFRAARPGNIMDMRAVAKPFLIRKGYDALTFFGHIITRTEEEARSVNERFGYLKNHEMIHLYQARSTHNSWLCFYGRYFIFWMKAFRYRRHLKDAGYLLNPFEMEAYRHMHDLDYLTHKQEATEWREYAQMSLEKRLEMIKR